MKLSSLFVRRAASAAAVLGVFALIASVVPLGAHADTSSVVINSINGQPPTGQCIAGTLTFDFSGVTGSNGGPYSIEVGNGLSTSTPVSAGAGKGTSFSHVIVTYTPTGASNSIFIDLFHGSDSGQDSHTILVNQCVAAPTQGVVNVIKNVVNDNGGTATPASFTMHIGGHSFAGSTTGTAEVLDANTYAVTEDSASGYTQTSLVCTGDDNSNTTNGSVVVAAGHNYTCTVTNDDNVPPPPTDTDLSVTKTVDNQTPLTGSTVTYTITAANAGPASATGVVVNDTLPPGVTWVSDNGAGAYDHTPGVWTVGNLASGASTTLQISASVDASDGGKTITNTASVTGSQNDPSAGNNSQSASFTGSCPEGQSPNSDGVCVSPPPSADLSVTKSVDNSAPVEGQNVIYTVTVHNAGPNDATGVVATDQLPAGETYVSDDSAGSAYNSTTGAWTIGSLASGANAVLHITAQVNTLSQTTNTATVTSDTSDPNHGDNTSGGVNVTAVCPQGTHPNSDSVCVANTGTLIVKKVVVNDNGGTKTASDFSFSVNDGNATAFNANGENDLVESTDGTYTVTETSAPGYTTTYSGDCTNVALTTDSSATCTITNDDIAPSLTLVKSVNNEAGGQASSTDWTLTATGNQESPGILSGAGGAVSGATFQAGSYVLSESTGPANYTASNWSCIGDTQNDGNSLTLGIGQSETCTITNTYVVPAPTNSDVSVTKTVDNASPSAGSTVTYTVTATNAGPADATGVSVSDVLPAGLTFVSATPATGSYDNGTGVWTIGTLASNASTTLQIAATVNSGTGAQTITNTATASSESHDPNADNNSGSVSFTVACPSGTHASGGQCVTDIVPHAGGGGGGGHGGGQVLGASTTGQVLGVSCGVYMDKHLRLGSSKNDLAQTKDLQNFLNKWMQANLPVTGFYGKLTFAATKAFQAKYADDILKPWGLTAPTGIVYHTTLYKINQLECPTLTQQLPPLVPWSQNPNAQ